MKKGEKATAEAHTSVLFSVPQVMKSLTMEVITPVNQWFILVLLAPIVLKYIEIATKIYIGRQFNFLKF